MNYYPIALPFFFIFLGALALLLVMVEIGVLRYAYERIGIHPRYVFALLLVSLLGAYINIPVAQLPPQHVLSGREVDFFGMRYVIPVVVDWPGTVIAVNVGGALVPAAVSLYLLARNGLWGPGLVAIALVTFVCHALAHPVPGVGIAIPIFIPPAVTAVVALALSRRYAAPLAYIAGSLGTLIGADLLNLGKLQGLGAPVASIGGAGTFDGVFLTGILAVLLAGLFTGRARA